MRGTTITINGQLYDARTGLPITAESKAQPARHAPRHTGKVMSDVGARPMPHSTATQVPQQKIASQPAAAPVLNHTPRTAKTAYSIHGAPQRSKTLHRAALKRPEAQREAIKTPATRSAAIQKYPPSLKTIQQQPQLQQSPPPSVTVAEQQPKVAAAEHQEPLQGSALKEKLIADKMASTMPKKEKAAKNTKTHRKYPRLASITSGIAALVLLGGYLTYLNLPNLSLRVAASQAGVAATYPTYQPSGYSFAGPVAYSPGEVRVNFKSNTNDFAYSVVQRESNWDSQAVRDNYVVKESKQYTTIQEGGITIYLVNNKAVWVNGGVLYSVEGNAPLSGEQIQKIASSTL